MKKKIKTRTWISLTEDFPGTKFLGIEYFTKTKKRRQKIKRNKKHKTMTTKINKRTYIGGIL
jgi:hypothetical protein